MVNDFKTAEEFIKKISGRREDGLGAALLSLHIGFVPTDDETESKDVQEAVDNTTEINIGECVFHCEKRGDDMVVDFVFDQAYKLTRLYEALKNYGKYVDFEHGFVDENHIMFFTVTENTMYPSTLSFMSVHPRFWALTVDDETMEKTNTIRILFRRDDTGVLDISQTGETEVPTNQQSTSFSANPYNIPESNGFNY